MTIRIKKVNPLFPLTLFFSMSPFFLPVPGLGTDLQPYALVLGLVILFLCGKTMQKTVSENICFLLLLIPVSVAVLFLILDTFSMKAFRGSYNHLSILIVFLALYVMLQKWDFPENGIKAVIWIWFIVANIQLFVDRSFLDELVSGERYDSLSRGVKSLCSEQSFFGISCFYFLYLANNFKKHKWPYMILITVMAALYAQSMMGILFVVIFYVGILLDANSGFKSVLALLGMIAGAAAAYLILSRFAPQARVIQLINEFLSNGVAETINDDASATVRMNSILNAIEEAFGNYLVPQSYGRRIGSGFGGLMVELGVFGLIETLVIAYMMSLHCKKLSTRIVYFVLVYIIMFSNTQMGNPQLLLAMATNLYFKKQEQVNEQTAAVAG